jgi:hypothetical protein
LTASAQFGQIPDLVERVRTVSKPSELAALRSALIAHDDEPELARLPEVPSRAAMRP